MSPPGLDGFVNFSMRPQTRMTKTGRLFAPRTEWWCPMPPPPHPPNLPTPTPIPTHHPTNGAPAPLTPPRTPPNPSPPTTLYSHHASTPPPPHPNPNPPPPPRRREGGKPITNTPSTSHTNSPLNASTTRKPPGKYKISTDPNHKRARPLTVPLLISRLEAGSRCLRVLKEIPFRANPSNISREFAAGCDKRLLHAPS